MTLTRHPAPGLTPHPAIDRPGIGVMMPALFPVPQNPIMAGRVLVRPGNGITTGLGFSWEDITASLPGVPGGLNQTWTNIQSSVGSVGSYLANPWVIGGLVLASVFLLRPGRSAYKSDLAQARDEYRRKVRGIRSRYPSVGRRAYRAALAAGEAF